MKTTTSAATSSNLVHTSTPSNRRAQPVRQTRTNPSRTSGTSAARAGPNGVARANDDPPAPPSLSSPPGFFPAITHFTDAITALPNEVIRHLTFLKEVDAKACGPEEQLFGLIDTALATPIPPSRLTTQETNDNAGQTRGDDNTNTSELPEGTNEGIIDRPAVSEAEVARHRIFFQLHQLATEMIGTLEEKIHVLSPATAALNKQLSRIDTVFPSVEQEFTEEARLGSMTHWAYSEKNIVGATDRPRRDLAAANSLATAAAVLNDREVAARSELRREAVQAKRQRNLHLDSDLDDIHPAKRGGDNTRRAGGGKNKRPGDGANGVGLGISNGASAGQHPPVKKRKTEKASVNAERAMVGVFGVNSTMKGGAGSPRETPATEKKRPRQTPVQNGGNRKRNTTNASSGQSPSLASSPVHSTFGGAAKDHRGSPHPASGRPSSSRARQTPAFQNAQEASTNGGGRSRAPSTSTKPNGSVTAIGDNILNPPPSRGGIDSRSSTKPLTSSGKDEASLPPSGVIPSPAVAAGSPLDLSKGLSAHPDDSIKGGGRDASPDKKPSRSGGRGSTSKTGTPVTATFPTSTDLLPNGVGVGGPKRPSAPASSKAASLAAKRSHKKGAGQAAILAAQQANSANASSASSTAGGSGSGAKDRGGAVPEYASENDEGEDADEADEDEPRYCYCNGVSYGEMVACDFDGCPREWFHWNCVGLKKPPGNANWYCDDCKERIKRGKTGGVTAR